MVNLALAKARSCREPNLGCRRTDRPGWCDALPKKSLHERCRMGRHIVVMKLICSLSHCECDGHTVHKLSQWHLTADWLALRESDCSQMCSKVSSDWLPSYIKAMQPVLEICKMDKYFLNSPCISIASHIYKIGKLQSLLQCTNFPHTFFVTWPCWFYFKCIYILYCLALFTVVPFMTAVTRICIFIAPSMFPAFL